MIRPVTLVFNVAPPEVELAIAALDRKLHDERKSDRAHPVFLPTGIEAGLDAK